MDCASGKSTLARTCCLKFRLAIRRLVTQFHILRHYHAGVLQDCTLEYVLKLAELQSGTSTELLPPRMKLMSDCTLRHIKADRARTDFALGALFSFHTLVTGLAARLQLEAYWQAQPEILQTKIGKPIIVLGLFRSGLRVRLLRAHSCSSAFRRHDRLPELPGCRSCVAIAESLGVSMRDSRLSEFASSKQDVCPSSSAACWSPRPPSKVCSICKHVDSNAISSA